MASYTSRADERLLQRVEEQARRLLPSAEIVAIGSYATVLEKVRCLEDARPRDWDFLVTVGCLAAAFWRLPHEDLPEWARERIGQVVGASMRSWDARAMPVYADALQFLGRTFPAIVASQPPRRALGDAIGTWVTWNLFGHTPYDDDHRALARLSGELMVAASDGLWDFERRPLPKSSPQAPRPQSQPRPQADASKQGQPSERPWWADDPDFSDIPRRVVRRPPLHGNKNAGSRATDQSNRLRLVAILLLGVVAAVAYVVLSDQPRLAIDRNCRVVGLTARARAAVQQRRFWQGQLHLLDREIKWIDEWPETQARLQRRGEEIIADSEKGLEELYRKYPGSRPSDAERRAGTLEKQADQLHRAAADARSREIFEGLRDDYVRCRPLVVTRGEEIDGRDYR